MGQIWLGTKEQEFRYFFSALFSMKYKKDDLGSFRILPHFELLQIHPTSYIKKIIWSAIYILTEFCKIVNDIKENVSPINTMLTSTFLLLISFLLLQFISIFTVKEEKYKEHWLSRSTSKYMQVSKQKRSRSKHSPTKRFFWLC